MSRLICKNCKYVIGEYTKEMDKLSRCPQCDSPDIARILVLADRLGFHENVKGKSNKMPGKKKPFSEFQAGKEFSHSKGYYVDKIRQIDRENDNYYEKVTDPKTGETIHECHEPLSQHFGHGSAKFSSEEGE